MRAAPEFLLSSSIKYKVLYIKHKTIKAVVPDKAPSHSNEKELKKKKWEIRVIFFPRTSRQAMDSHVNETAKEMSEQTSAGTSRSYCRRGTDFFDNT